MKRKDTCQEQLVSYLKNNPGWYKKVQLFVLGDEWGYSPETIGRKLRLATESGEICVEYYDGKYAKGLARYCHDKPKELIRKVEIINGKPTWVEKYA